ncbi:UvrD-helicase domain-containing protein [Moraxella nasovis]|uniref:UvrD-helicase domain-containing protein n=1 Tax=Moraxella nasovis TaxID=2904121 RepID=UPI001F605A29|nr:UvrD-helicase domain-containing protein [Moraxella nasovis]UNU73250.1 UvrD-helicase domain-containing protein [Moraxella nasovis]
MTNNTSHPNQNATGTPALDCSLTGGYLIEASAGTGKTWTLTGIVLRLLIEKRYRPEQIIATTFTKDAAAEMQERIYDRISNFYRCLSWLKTQQNVYPDWFGGVDQKNINQVMAEITAWANASMIAGFDDLVNAHLVAYILTDEDLTALDRTIAYTRLLLANLDKLFVGTFDSLAHKLLREFAAEIGQHGTTTIIQDVKPIIKTMIHDRLRYEHSRLKHHSPNLYQLIDKSVFGKVDTAYEAVKMTIQFFGVPIDEAESVDDEYIKELQEQLTHIQTLSIEPFGCFEEADYRNKVGINKNIALSKNIHHLPQVMNLVCQHGLKFYQLLTKEQKEWLDKAQSGVINVDKVFKKDHDKKAKALFSELAKNVLTPLADMHQQISKLTILYQQALYKTLAIHIQKTIGSVMESSGKTSFFLQMNRLNTALKRSPDLARHICHQYPVALIDEAQDVNEAQMSLVESIYLNDLRHKADLGKTPKGFLLFVGDPKQAIYRFRGGDVMNYNAIKQKGKYQGKRRTPIINQELALLTNRRSNQRLIQVLNTWFENNNQIGTNNHAYLGDGIYYQNITAHNQDCRLSWHNADDKAQVPPFLGNSPVTMLTMSNSVNEYQQTALHIDALLRSKQTINDGGVPRAILPRDIAVLATTNPILLKVQEQLQKLGIASFTSKSQSIFDTKAAMHLHALLVACMDVTHREKIGRLLTSSLFNWSLDEVLAQYDATLQNGQSDSLLYLTAYLRQIYDRWQKYSIANALNYALSTNPFDKRDESGLWTNIASHGERHVADVWQLVEIIGSQPHISPVRLLEWYDERLSHDEDKEFERAVLPSDIGVNLMTAHGSKGLEFPIVYVLGLNSSAKNRQQWFYPYSDDKPSRRLSPRPDKIMEDGLIEVDYYKRLNKAEELDERRRLSYVALTRASEQVYIVFAQASKNTSSPTPLMLWLEMKDKNITIPSRLDIMDRIDISELSQPQTAYHDDQCNLTPIKYVNWDVAMAHKRFIAAYDTSFTALVSRLDGRYERMAGVQDDESYVPIKHLEDISDNPQDASYPPDDIRIHLPKGAVMGSFLHEILQKMRPSDQRHISQAIDDTVQRMGLSYDLLSHHAKVRLGYTKQSAPIDKNTTHRKLVQWLLDIATTPFHSGISLSELSDKLCVKEMGFMLGLGDDFSVAKLNEVFKCFSDKPIRLSDDDTNPWYRHLRGSIDLLYSHNGKFYVVDYKSNFLGDKPSYYTFDQLEMAMEKAGYWLQAAIYQVALHRLLKLKIADYCGNETQYLGATEYVFLRGVECTDATLGRITWQVPFELVKKLDEIFE